MFNQVSLSYPHVFSNEIKEQRMLWIISVMERQTIFVVLFSIFRPGFAP